MSRFDEIKQRFAEGWDSGNQRLADIGWLIADRESTIASAATLLSEANNEIAGLRADNTALKAALAEAQFTIRKLVGWPEPPGSMFGVPRDAERAELRGALGVAYAHKVANIAEALQIYRARTAVAAPPTDEPTETELTGENLRDRGVTEPGGVGDGAQ